MPSDSIDHAAEEVETPFRYLSGYARPRPIGEQSRILRGFFPQLAAADESWEATRLPRQAEGYFVLPRWQSIASSYNDAFHIVLDLLERTRNGAFFNNRDGQTGPQGMRQLEASASAFDAIAREQGGADALIVPAQFGLRHRGRSVRRARERFGPDEFGLGAFHLGVMLLTHPERLGDVDDLFVDAPGDEFDDAAAESRFGRTPCFCFEHGKLEFGTHWTDRAYERNSSASAFMPRPKAAFAAAAATAAPIGAFAEEETRPRNSYVSGYSRPRPLAEQVAKLKSFLPDLGDADLSVADRPLPPSAEGWFAVPRWERVAATYHDALERSLDMLARDRNGRFFNYRRGRLGPDVLRQHALTSAAFAALCSDQPRRDILILPAQFGLLHAGRSIRRSREVFADGEFGLGAYHVAMMLLTHPERLAHADDVWPDCAGDEYDDVKRPERYGRAPRFIFDGGQIEFGTHWINRAEDKDGSVSAFR